MEIKKNVPEIIPEDYKRFTSFAPSIIKWYDQNKRDLPWRETTDPYKIWLSEIILQQTRVVQGLPYYNKFVQTFPDVHSLASASEEEVLKLWQGLGYYSRARNLHTCAKQVVQEFDGHFPGSFKELKKLKGIGDYTAAAISSIAFKEKVPVLDGNVFRVISRIFGIEHDIANSTSKPVFNQILKQLISPDHPDEFNQGIMEFGALHCTPKNPACGSCIFSEDCLSNTHDMQQLLPVKSSKKKPRDRHFTYLIFKYADTIYMNIRPKGDIWTGLYDFHLLENQQEQNIESHFNQDQLSSITLLHESKTYKHILTHQHIYATFYVLEIREPDLFQEFLSNMLAYNENEIVNLPLPRLVDKYLNEEFFSLALIKR